jgi:hypothetical protein
MSKSLSAGRIADDASCGPSLDEVPGPRTPTVQGLLDAGRRDAPARGDDERVWSALCRRFMRSPAGHRLSAAMLISVLGVCGCAPKNDAPQANTPSTQPTFTSYPQYAPATTSAGAVPVAPTTPAVGSTASATTYPSAPAQTGTSAMAVPGPLALPCQNDQSCMLARCNVQYQKCAYPCQSQVDCAQNAACNQATGLCIPAGR